MDEGKKGNLKVNSEQSHELKYTLYTFIDKLCINSP